ncbi:MAG TPA: hypothetical protein VHR86_10000 [Armatimonadota bacterium]|nr:hypothetical protein [Armatimonadota bacterium]
MKLAIWCYGWLLVIGFLALEWSILRYALARHRRGERYSARYAIGDSVCITALLCISPSCGLVCTSR